MDSHFIYMYSHMITFTNLFIYDSSLFRRNIFLKFITSIREGKGRIPTRYQSRSEDFFLFSSFSFFIIEIFTSLSRLWWNWFPTSNRSSHYKMSMVYGSLYYTTLPVKCRHYEKTFWTSEQISTLFLVQLSVRCPMDRSWVLIVPVLFVLVVLTVSGLPSVLLLYVTP